jgi:hypothetical protein
MKLKFDPDRQARSKKVSYDLPLTFNLYWRCTFLSPESRTLWYRG